MASLTLPSVNLMHPTLVATPFHRPAWIYEEKVDGYRMVAYKQRGSAQLISRQGKEFTQRFPELTKAVAGLGAESVILDTELAVFDRQLNSRFEWLRARPKNDVATPPMLKHRHFAVERVRLCLQAVECLHELREAASMVTAIPAHELHRTIRFDGDHAPAVHLLFVDPALAVEGAQLRSRA